MTSIRITIETDGAAFHEGDESTLGQCTFMDLEVVRILRVLADDTVVYGIDNIDNQPWLYDLNGNVVGKVEVID